MRSQAEKAEDFRQLHHREHILILPNGWDVPSARIFEDAGFEAVATTSAGMMVSLGYPDGESIPRSEFLAAVERIGRVLTVPLSVDLVAGFGETINRLESTVRQVVKAGAAGLNIEDFVHSTKRLHPIEKQVERVRAIRKLGETLRVPIVINARTDAFRYAEGDESARLKEAIKRGTAYRDAGADCIYPMGLTDSSSISMYVNSLKFPVNVMVRKGLPTIKELERLGVARVSFGPTASYAAMGLLKRIAREVLERGTYDSMLDQAISYDELNGLAGPREKA